MQSLLESHSDTKSVTHLLLAFIAMSVPNAFLHVLKTAHVSIQLAAGFNHLASLTAGIQNCYLICISKQTFQYIVRFQKSSPSASSHSCINT